MIANILISSFIDESIQMCSERRFGKTNSYVIGVMFRLFEFGIISALPPFILIEYSNKYNTIIAAVVSFFGMKMFSNIVAALSQDSMPTMIRQLRESNVEQRIQLQELKDSNARLETSNARLEEAIATLIKSAAKQHIELRKDIQNSYDPYDPYENGD